MTLETSWLPGDSLGHFQEAHKVWLNHNFPGQTSHQALLGLVEEVGELAHAHLKHEQEIRGLTYEEYRKQASDAIGDIMVYLASYCNTNGFQLDYCLYNTWREVSARDWIKYPETGRPPTDADGPAAEVLGSADGGNLG